MLPRLIESLAGSFLVLFFVIFYLLRAAATLRARLRGHRIGFFPSSGAMGNAFQHLQALAHPEVQHILEEKQQEDVDEDDDGDPDDPAAQLERQLKRIRNGETIDRLMVRLR